MTNCTVRQGHPWPDTCDENFVSTFKMVSMLLLLMYALPLGLHTLNLARRIVSILRGTQVEPFKLTINAMLIVSCLCGMISSANYRDLHYDTTSFTCFGVLTGDLSTSFLGSGCLFYFFNYVSAINKLVQSSLGRLEMLKEDLDHKMTHLKEKVDVEAAVTPPAQNKGSTPDGVVAVTGNKSRTMVVVEWVLHFLMFVVPLLTNTLGPIMSCRAETVDARNKVQAAQHMANAIMVFMSMILQLQMVYASSKVISFGKSIISHQRSDNGRERLTKEVNNWVTLRRKYILYFSICTVSICFQWNIVGAFMQPSSGNDMLSFEGMTLFAPLTFVFEFVKFFLLIASFWATKEVTNKTRDCDDIDQANRQQCLTLSASSHDEVLVVMWSLGLTVFSVFFLLLAFIYNEFTVELGATGLLGSIFFLCGSHLLFLRLDRHEEVDACENFMRGKKVAIWNWVFILIEQSYLSVIALDAFFMWWSPQWLKIFSEILWGTMSLSNSAIKQLFPDMPQHIPTLILVVLLWLFFATELAANFLVLHHTIIGAMHKLSFVILDIAVMTTVSFLLGRMECADGRMVGFDVPCDLSGWHVLATIHVVFLTGCIVVYAFLYASFARNKSTTPRVWDISVFSGLKVVLKCLITISIALTSQQTGSWVPWVRGTINLVCVFTITYVSVKLTPAMGLESTRVNTFRSVGYGVAVGVNVSGFVSLACFQQSAVSAMYTIVPFVSFILFPILGGVISFQIVKRGRSTIAVKAMNNLCNDVSQCDDISNQIAMVLSLPSKKQKQFAAALTVAPFRRSKHSASQGRSTVQTSMIAILGKLQGSTHDLASTDKDRQLLDNIHQLRVFVGSFDVIREPLRTLRSIEGQRDSVWDMHEATLQLIHHAVSYPVGIRYVSKKCAGTFIGLYRAQVLKVVKDIATTMMHVDDLKASRHDMNATMLAITHVVKYLRGIVTPTCSILSRTVNHSRRYKMTILRDNGDVISVLALVLNNLNLIGRLQSDISYFSLDLPLSESLSELNSSLTSLLNDLVVRSLSSSEAASGTISMSNEDEENGNKRGEEGYHKPIVMCNLDLASNDVSVVKAMNHLVCMRGFTTDAATCLLLPLTPLRGTSGKGAAISNDTVTSVLVSGTIIIVSMEGFVDVQDGSRPARGGGKQEQHRHSSDMTSGTIIPYLVDKIAKELIKFDSSQSATRSKMKVSSPWSCTVGILGASEIVRAGIEKGMNKQSVNKKAMRITQQNYISIVALPGRPVEVVQSVSEDGSAGSPSRASSVGEVHRYTSEVIAIAEADMVDNIKRAQRIEQLWNSAGIKSYL